MKTGLLAAAMWIAILGYFALYHGITLVTGNPAVKSSTSGTGGPDPVGYLSQQDYIR